VRAPPSPREGAHHHDGDTTATHAATIPCGSAREHRITVARVIAIRRASAADVDAVLAFWRDATVEPSTTDDREGVLALLRFAPDALLLAVDGEEIVGSLIASWDGWRGAMYRLAVHPAYRRRGIASRLVAAAERTLRSHGVRRVHLIVLAEEEPANAFWDASGYAHEARQRRYVKTLRSQA
jgi:ribosomal protein S18 acetylase RimI-like enzyme